MRLRRWGMLLSLGCTVAACGATQGQNRFDLRTPGANTGAPLAATPAPTAVPDVTPEATPGIMRKPVTASEKRIIRGWSDELRHGRVTAASRYFAVPSLVLNATPQPSVLRSRGAVEAFNRTLPCGAKLIRTRRGSDNFVVGIFRLTERPGGGGCDGPGTIAAVAFLIESKHITSWVRVPEDPAPAPSATATPEATAAPSPSATATASPSPTPSGTPTPSPSPIPTTAAGMPDRA